MSHDKIGAKEQQLRDLAARKRKRRRAQPSSTPSEVADRMQALGDLKTKIKPKPKRKD